MDILQEQLHASLQEKGRAPGAQQPQPLGASLRNQNAHGHLTRAILIENLQETAAPQDHHAQFVRACVVEMHTYMSEEPIYARIYRKMPLMDM